MPPACRKAARSEGSVSSANSALPPPREDRPSKLDAYEAAVVRLLERYPRMTAVRIFEELKQQGYSGGYTILRERVKQLRSRPSKPLVTRFETAPGAQTQMDWDECQTDFAREGRRTQSWTGLF